MAADDRDLLADLLAAERRVGSAPAADRARVWSALATKLPATPPPLVPVAAAKSVLPWIVAGVIATVVAIVVAVVAITRSPSPSLAPPVPAPAPAPAPAPTPTPAPPPPKPVPPPAPAPAPGPTSVEAPKPKPAPAPATKQEPPKPAAPAETPKPPADEVTEDMLIERARISLARARFDEALTLLTEHETRYPGGALRGDRELLIIRALLGTSNRPAAEQRAAAFRRADPTNPSLRAIDAALAH